jgi:pimeloyl-ACP methyl ester carboxylesterase
MEAQPTGLARPLVVVDGWLPHGALTVSRQLKRLTGASHDEMMSFSYGLGSDLESLARRLLRRIEERWPAQDPEWSVEVDVVGFSLGGAVARVAALEPASGGPRKRLRIRRLFTISTPHRGTVGFARLLAPDESARAVRPGSEALRRLDAALPEAPYELFCYGQLNDLVVGARNTAPPGHDPFWTDGPPLVSHLLSGSNRRFLADIALRLRGEPPLAGLPSRPPRD